MKQEATVSSNTIPNRSSRPPAVEPPGLKRLRTLLRDEGVYSFKELMALLRPDFSPKGAELGAWLKTLDQEGTLIARGDKLYVTSHLPIVEGKVQWHVRGHAVLHVDDGSTLFLPKSEAARVLNGEIIKARRVPAAWRENDVVGDDEGLVLDVVRSGLCFTVGESVGTQRQGWLGEVRVCEPMLLSSVRLSDRHVTKNTLSQDQADQVVATGTLLAGTLRRAGPFDRGSMLKAWFDVQDVVGRWDEPGIESRLAWVWMEGQEQFPSAALDEAYHHAEKAGSDTLHDPARRDAKHLPLVTIDGSSTRDFDDAIGAQKLPDQAGWKVWVAIADVSAYVPINGALDHAAQRRATSVYLPHRTIPMLPDVLSEGVCSLMPGVDRAALMCEATVSQQGEVTDVRFYTATIRSQARLLYEDVDRFIVEQALPVDRLGPVPGVSSGDPSLDAWSTMVRESVTAMVSVAEILRAKRTPAEFERREQVWPVLNDQGKAERLALTHDMTPANKLVEEFMLLANREAARFLHHHGISPVLFRNQRRPEDGQSMLKSATYGTVNEGHYSLNDAHYTHFTSPIRRYPDLMVHRALKKAIGHTMEHLPSMEETQRLGEHCADVQRRAKGAGLKAKQWLILDYAQRHAKQVEPAEILKSLPKGWVVRGKTTLVEGFLMKPANEIDVQKAEADGVWMSIDRVDRYTEKVWLKAEPNPLAVRLKEEVEVGLQRPASDTSSPIIPRRPSSVA